MSSVSGKLVIIAVVIVAVAAAGTSWWFRYASTHRAAEFWGPEAATLIRDAPQVTLFRKPTAELISLALTDTKRAGFDESAHDISRARGLVHLRTALLEDLNFIWNGTGESSPNDAHDISSWVLTFHDPKSDKTARIMFSEDCERAWRTTTHLFAYELTSVSTKPIAKGLREMFAELTVRAEKRSR